MSKGNHDQHPGHTGDGCELRIKVIAHPLGSSYNGYACSYTGGHCVPCESCEAMVKAHNYTEQQFFLMNS